MKLYTINCGNFKLDGGAMFGVVPKTMWQKLNAPDENNLCSWATRSMLIEEGDRLILVDCGLGDKQDAKFFGHYYLHGDDSLDKSLNKYGFCRDDITDVFLTHLHFDHCGGAIIRSGDQLIPSFKNAVYWSNQKHWQWATTPNAREKASFLKENIIPIQESGKLKWIGDESQENSKLGTAPFTPDMMIRFASGHTDAMMLPQINYKNRTIVYMADLLPSQAHIPLPYVMAYDTRPLLTLKEKELFLNEAVDNNYILYFEHDPVYECCTLQRTEKGIRPKDFFTLDDL